MLAYKVVQPGSRASCVAEGIYKKIYSPGSVVTAQEGTLGIFCFETSLEAWEWVQSGLNRWMVIEVNGLGHPTTPTKILVHEFIWATDIRDYSSCLVKTYIPKGTICFESVEVPNV